MGLCKWAGRARNGEKERDSAPVGGATRETRVPAFGRFGGCRLVRRGRIAGGGNFLFGEDEAADIAERLVPDSHLFEVVLPDGVGVGARRAARKGFSPDGDDFSAGIEARVLLRGKKEGDLCALLPEVTGELVGKEESVITSTGGKGADRLLKAGPFGFETELKPLTEFKAMDTGAEDDDAKEFLACHGIFWERGEK